MSLKSSVIVSGVTKIYRHGIGEVYRSIIPIEDLYTQLNRSLIRYSPKYQEDLKLAFEIQRV